jgi:hypothetical protein
VKIIPKKPNTPNTILSTPNTVTEAGRCIILPFEFIAPADNLKNVPVHW